MSPQVTAPTGHFRDIRPAGPGRSALSVVCPPRPIGARPTYTRRIRGGSAGRRGWLRVGRGPGPPGVVSGASTRRRREGHASGTGLPDQSLTCSSRHYDAEAVDVQEGEGSLDVGGWPQNDRAGWAWAGVSAGDEGRGERTHRVDGDGDRVDVRTGQWSSVLDPAVARHRGLDLAGADPQTAGWYEVGEDRLAYASDETCLVVGGFPKRSLMRSSHPAPSRRGTRAPLTKRERPHAVDRKAPGPGRGVSRGRAPNDGSARRCHRHFRPVLMHPTIRFISFSSKTLTKSPWSVTGLCSCSGKPSTEKKPRDRPPSFRLGASTSYTRR